MLAERSGITTTELTPLIGTEIKADAETLLSGKFAKDIRALLEQRGVLVFRNVQFADEQQIAFTRTLGTQAHEYSGGAVGGKKHDIFKVSLDSRVNPRGAAGLKTSFFWHLDGSMHEVPILASILTPKVLSPTGGQTEFCNTYAAYEALPEAEKTAIDKLKVVHANWARSSYTNPEPSYEEFKRAVSAIAPKEQPLVWKHRSGRKSLVVGLTAAYVVGLEPLESRELLVRLRDWATQPQFVYLHEWSLDDMIMWDNTGTLHRALPYDPNCGRLMHRTMLAGEEPFA
jgi:alpha-ketoglutarate-dependent taurine dioxygenase